jgi:DnaB-like helicase C terminal domain
MSLLEKDDEVVLPGNEEFQKALIGHCLNDPRFFMQCYGKIKAQWFTQNIMLANVFEQMVKSFDTHGVVPKSIGELMNEPFFLEQDVNSREKYKTLLGVCSYFATGNRSFSLDKIKKTLTDWLQACMFQEAMLTGVSKFKRLNKEGIAWTAEQLKKVTKATFQDDSAALKFDNPVDWLKADAIEREQAVSTGSKNLDFALGGGLFRGETTAIMAPVNTGKSTFMMTIVRHAIKQGKKVLWITHEDNSAKLRQRMLCAFLGVTRQTLTNPDVLGNPAAMKDLVVAGKFIDQYLVYLPYAKIGGMFVEDLAAEIERRHNEMKINTGSGFDMIVDDYPKKLRMRSNSPEHYRNELAGVYDAFNHIALALNVHCFVAIQTNRDGMKQNMGKVKSDFLIGMDQVDESYGIAQNMGNIISLNRSPDDKLYNIARFSITKSRNDITDIAVSTRTAYAQTLTHGDREMFDPNIRFSVTDPKNHFEPVEKMHRISYLMPQINSKTHDENDMEFRNPENWFLASEGHASSQVLPPTTVNEQLKQIESGLLTPEMSNKNFVDLFNPNRDTKLNTGVQSGKLN